MKPVYNKLDILKAFQRLNIKNGDSIFLTTNLGMLGMPDTKNKNLRIMKYYNPGLQNYTDKFWNETLIGKLIPFTPVLYVDPNNAELQSDTFKKGYIAIYVRDIKYPSDGQGPFQLVYASPSFEMDSPGELTGPIIYKINKDYNPNQ